MKVYKSTKKNGHIFFIIYVHLYIFLLGYRSYSMPTLTTTPINITGTCIEI